LDVQLRHLLKNFIGTPFRRAILIALNVEWDDFKKIYEWQLAAHGDGTP